MNAYNFDITDWEPVSHQNPDEKKDFGHQWPRYWYQKSVAATNPDPNSVVSGFENLKYGYRLSLEGGGSIDRFKELTNKWPLDPPQACILKDENTQIPPLCDFK